MHNPNLPIIFLLSLSIFILNLSAKPEIRILGDGSKGKAIELNDLFHTSPLEWKEPRQYHSSITDKAFKETVSFSKGNWPSIILNKKYSVNKAYWYAIVSANYRKDPPWNSSIFIYNERQTPMQLQIKEHGNTEVQIKWINEKIIYVEFWKGKILGVCFLYDVEKENVFYKEYIRDGRIPFQQFHQSKDKVKNEKVKSQ